MADSSYLLGTHSEELERLRRKILAALGADFLLTPAEQGTDGAIEVALRAAFIAVQAGKQVALLVPTTLLAQQHFQTFSDRFADTPVRVEVLSRFRSGADSRRIRDGLAAGKVDIAALPDWRAGAAAGRTSGSATSPTTTGRRASVTRRWTGASCRGCARTRRCASCSRASSPGKTRRWQRMRLARHAMGRC